MQVEPNICIQVFQSTFIILKSMFVCVYQNMWGVHAYILSVVNQLPSSYEKVGWKKKANWESSLAVLCNGQGTRKCFARGCNLGTPL